MHLTNEIEWESDQSYLLLNPRMPEEEKEVFKHIFQDVGLSSHLLMAASGTSGVLRVAAISKEAVLSSASAVNRHLQSKASDVWVNPLPFFHVGGVGIFARSYLSGSRVVELKGKWDPDEFVNALKESLATLTALVPAQIFDIIQKQLVAPERLRAAIVGGGALDEALYLQAVGLGWKLLPSYGLTECASQVATAPLDSWKEGVFPLLQPLDHVKLALNEKGLLKIHGPSLLSYYFLPDASKKSYCYFDPKVEGWLTTSDYAILVEGKIKSVHKEEHLVKIGGENVDLLRLEMILETLKIALAFSADMAVFAMPHARLGAVIHLAVANDKEMMVDDLLHAFHARVNPYERIRSIHYVDAIPRTSLHKVLRHHLIEKVRP